MYEIPQQLAYKEKIIFGLTFSQLAYALVFLPIIFSLLFKIKANIYVRVSLALFPTLLAVGFMYFDLLTHLKNWYTWFRFRELGGEKIREVFELNDGDFNEKEKDKTKNCNSKS